jgi:hypothetical protein
MANPFPGMNPWLEAAHLWPGFHSKLINETVAVLQPQLRERGYYADSGERVWLSEAGRAVYPDNVVFHLRGREPVAAGSALLAVEEPVRVKRVEFEVRESFVEIFDATSHRLVTGIEFLSPANKLEPRGRELYQQKQRELRAAGVHLVEIDLIRRGQHVLDVPPAVVEARRPWHYLVNVVRRSADEHQFHPIGLRSGLPRFRLPLRTGDEDAALDLAEVFARAYAIGPYEERIDYTLPPPEPAFSKEDTEWLAERLAARE